MKSKLSVLENIYRGLLTISPFIAHDDGTIKHSVSKNPWVIDRKEVSLPTRGAMKRSDIFMIFHPLKEKMLLGPSKVVTNFRDACTEHLNHVVMPLFITELYDNQQNMKNLPMATQAIVSGYPKLTRDDVKHMGKILLEFPCFDISILMSNVGNPKCNIVTSFPLLKEVFSILEDKANPPVVGNYKSSRSALVKFSEIMLKLLSIKEGDLSITTESSEDIEAMLDTKRLPSIVMVYLAIANILMGDIETLILDGSVLEFVKLLSEAHSNGYDLQALVSLSASNDQIAKKRPKVKKRKHKKRKKRKHRRYRTDDYDCRRDPPWDTGNQNRAYGQQAPNIPDANANGAYGKLTEEEIAMVNLGLITPSNIRSGKKPSLEQAKNPQVPMGYPTANGAYPMTGYPPPSPQAGFGILPGSNPAYMPPPMTGYPQQPPMTGYPQQPAYVNPPPMNGGYPQQGSMGYPQQTPSQTGGYSWGNKYRR